MALVCVPSHGATEQPTIELGFAARDRLGAIKESWAEWLSAYGRGDVDGARVAVDQLLTRAGEVGATRLPDLARAAGVAAVEAARNDSPEGVTAALEAAERLDPGRPEAARARLVVARESGSWFEVVYSWFEIRLAALRLPLDRLLWWNDFLTWALLLLLVVGGLFSCVVVGLRAWRAPLDLARMLHRVTPVAVAYPATLVLLFWPVALPGGPLWLLAWWSALAWTYASRGERVLLIVAWLAVGAAPILVSAQSERLSMALTPPARALESLETGRLTGSLFSDLEVLRSLIPESLATQHLLADVHRRLGQWQLAGQLYRTLLEREPDNVAATIDLGSYRFQFGDIEGSRRELERALAIDPGNAAAYFNLSQVHSAAYDFGPAEAALLEARALDPERVSEWVRGARESRLVSLDGGLGRIEEIRLELADAWRDSGLVRAWPDLLVRALSIPWALGMIALAAGFHLIRGRTPSPRLPNPPPWWEEWGQPLVEAFVPGHRSLASGRAVHAFAALVLPSFLLTLPVIDSLVFHLPSAAGLSLPGWIVVVAALALYLGLRVRRRMGTG